MTTILITPPPIACEVTAEQVAAYLLRPGSGWVEWSTVNTTRAFRIEAIDPVLVLVSREPSADTIEAIARAEGRYPSAVLADIVGPARAASVGVACVTGESLDERVNRTRCAMRAATERHARRLRLERATEDADSAARGAGESEE